MAHRAGARQPIVAITAFNIDRYTTVEGFVAEYRLIGLDTIELNGRVRERVIVDLLPYIERGEIKISSLHTFCPQPEVADAEEPNLASPDEEERRAALRRAQKTIATAGRLGASAVVVHAGAMPALRPLAEEVKELYRAGRGDSAGFARLRAELVERRRREGELFVQAAERSVVELAEYVERQGWRVRLGLENRDLCGQIPQAEEYDAWFARYPDAPIGLWFDTGHAQILQSLGLGDQRALLERHGERLVGLHLHDCLGVDDHIVPGSGGVDFDLLRPYLRPDVLRVLEYGRRIQPVERIVDGIRYLRERGILGPS